MDIIIVTTMIIPMMIAVEALARGVREGGEPMLDIHSHILPNVDDGARSLEESIEMARIYLDNGIDRVIATPHYIEGAESSTKDQNLQALESLKEALRHNRLNLKVYLGNEVYSTMNIMSYLEEGKIATLNNSRYLLIELPMFDIPLYMENLIYELLLKGYIPIIAHPERNTKIIEDPNILYDFIGQGALAQMNLPSIEGRYGSNIRATGEILLKHNMIHFVGTDAHSKNRRSPNVGNGLNILKKLVGQKIYEEIIYSNGLKVIEDEEITIESPIKYKEKKGFFKDNIRRIVRSLQR